MKPERLRPGDAVGIVSPSWYGGDAFAHRVERGVEKLRSIGFSVKIAPHALNASGYVSDTAENRAADIHAMFADPEVRAIIATIGGDHANQLLPLLDWDLIRANPKIFMGFSDITVLNVAIWTMTGLVTFNQRTLPDDRLGGIPSHARLQRALRPARVDAMLMDYENMGVFAQIRGLLLARPYGYDDEQRASLHDVLRERTRKFTFPVVANMDFGHTTPIFTLPIGVRAMIDGEAQRFTIVEAAVR